MTLNCQKNNLNVFIKQKLSLNVHYRGAILLIEKKWIAMTMDFLQQPERGIVLNSQYFIGLN
jgi:hypothetical protein